MGSNTPTRPILEAGAFQLPCKQSWVWQKCWLCLLTALLARSHTSAGLTGAISELRRRSAYSFLACIEKAQVQERKVISRALVPTCVELVPLD